MAVGGMCAENRRRDGKAVGENLEGEQEREREGEGKRRVHRFWDNFRSVR